MNERLVELYKQATKTAYETVGVEHANTSYFQGIVNGMFAELIVRECANLVTDDDNAFDILKHFGVES